ncbi:spore cortex-lytic enzyme precursor [Oxobacter pfennigii]|uniref:Spore cortex-lytic enzyme n=2 Tax=Oxobacter pfennigii TaxID=36849 RepID=A0A0P8WJE9_9CLOT|nr:spore cortex-lytic enzyme precursor [Oxobacter pfennigii]
MSMMIALALTAPVLFNGHAFAASTLAVKSTGAEVLKLQENLKALGYFNGSNPTGNYGTLTRFSVMKFQAANGLSTDGIAGPATLSKVDTLIGGKSQDLYTVNEGDTLWIISQKYGTTSDRLKIINSLAGDTIYPGQKLSTLDEAKTVSEAASVTAEVSEENIYWLARIIESEASGEPYLGKVAVGNVILNRMESKDFPDTIKEVIFDDYKGIPQFSPVADGTIYNTPGTDSIKAAKEALSGSRPVGNATYFFNPDKSAGEWIVKNKTYLTRIGEHVFYQ